MRKTICMLIIAVLTGICFSAYAEINMDYHISNVELLQGDEYSRNTKADVYGFEDAKQSAYNEFKSRNIGTHTYQLLFYKNAVQVTTLF